ncbi:MAG: ABC transporter substrate-binding protein, partial [Candidatus Thiodiazotropha sp.]
MSLATSHQGRRQPRVRRYLALWLLALLPGAAHPAGPPQRVVSINLCADQLLLMLADADQVASVSHLAIEPLSSFVAEQARNYPLNHAKAEEIIALRPDLVLATAHNSPRLLTTLESLGYRVERLHLGRQPTQIIEDLRHLADILGQPEQGERLIQVFQSRLGEAPPLSPEQRPGALFYQPRGYTSGRDTLQDEA